MHVTSAEERILQLEADVWYSHTLLATYNRVARETGKHVLAYRGKGEAHGCVELYNTYNEAENALCAQPAALYMEYKFISHPSPT